MGRTYDSSETFEALYSQMFEQIATDDPDGMDELVDLQMVIRFRVREPDIELWIDGSSKPVVTSFGPQDLDATLTANLTADSMH